MIKLICPKCGSDKVHYNDIEQNEDHFKCEDCKNVFNRFNTEWKQE
jgi:transposase-like protein